MFSKEEPPRTHREAGQSNLASGIVYKERLYSSLNGSAVHQNVMSISLSAAIHAQQKA
jgi:hypothetical protein